MTAKKIILLTLFVLGMILMILNVTGLFKSLRNEELYSEITPYKDDISIRFEEAKKLWDRGENESVKDFTARATMLVNKSMAHYWRDEGIKKYHMRIPLWENYILRIQAMDHRAIRNMNSGTIKRSLNEGSVFAHSHA